ncbi:MAG: hypothetical protein J6035_03140, partial [Bacteroidaceae bacterium]|nr:hypothetical protein [Bacteroidaceae bacterium]
MKKLTFLVYHREYDSFLRDLQALGVVHIQKSGDQTMAEPATLRTLRQQLCDVRSVLSSLQQIAGVFLEDVPVGSAGVTESIEASQAMKLVRRVQEIESSLVALKPRMEQLQRDVEVLRPWGTIDRTLMKKLHDAGLREHYRIASAKRFEQKFPGYASMVVNRDKRFVYFLTFD